MFKANKRQEMKKAKLHYVNSIVGWQFPETTIKKYLDVEKSRLLTMDFDFPCRQKCNLKCRYCFIETDERELERKIDKISNKLTYEELEEVFKQAATLGCKSAKLVGDQESFLEKRFLEFLNFTSEELKMWVVVFTNGLVLANEEQCINIHHMSSQSIIEKLKGLRVSIMLKFHSFSDHVEDDLVRRPGYAAKRNVVLDRLIKAGFNEPPEFESPKEQFLMTGVPEDNMPITWTRLGLESVLTPQCLQDVEEIYRMKVRKKLYVDIDPPVPVGLTRSREEREKNNLSISPKETLDVCLRLYGLNEELGIPYEGPSPYFGGLPCSQLPYSLYVNARGRIYPCCGCPDKEVDGRSEYLGNVAEPNALLRAIESNPYRVHYKKYGFAYDSPPFNSQDYHGYGIYHGCAYRDRAGDILPKKWELSVEKYVNDLKKRKSRGEFYG